MQFKEILKNIDGIMWDMDGVLVDVTNSYRLCIRRTASFFLEREVSEKEVTDIKKLPGMNNDWDATFALIYGQKVKLDGSKFLEVKDKFQQMYLGVGQSEAFETSSDGLINSEELFLSKEKLSLLKAKYKKMGIATGRPRLEAQFILDKYELNNIFDEIVAMEDTKLGKPNPEPLILLMDLLKIKNTIYIGDTINDALAAKSAGVLSIIVGKSKGDLNLENTDNLFELLIS